MLHRWHCSGRNSKDGEEVNENNGRKYEGSMCCQHCGAGATLLSRDERQC